MWKPTKKGAANKVLQKLLLFSMFIPQTAEIC